MERRSPDKKVFGHSRCKRGSRFFFIVSCKCPHLDRLVLLRQPHDPGPRQVKGVYVVEVVVVARVRGQTGLGLVSKQGVLNLRREELYKAGQDLMKVDFFINCSAIFAMMCL